MNKTEIDIEFKTFKDELVSFLFRLTSNKHLAEDNTPDTCLKVDDKIDSFKDFSTC